MNTLYDLVKRIDALTANSQQVLNALIRSCIATGSSSGYKVTKFDHTISMARADIYRLYDFYNTWEQAGFPSDGEFDRLLAHADTRWRRGRDDGSTLATDAVVKHSMILYMDSSNKDTTDAGYWTTKIKEAASGKAVVSTAPIPINLRTPLYDENLSVKSFSQYETYLFPLGYRRTEILGTPGNGEDYVAGGKNWEIDVTDFFKVGASHITMGNVSNAEPKLTNYRNSYYTFSWGDESYALATRSLAMGERMLALARNSAAIGGHNSIAYAESSLATGSYTMAPGNTSSSFNSGTVSGGIRSLAANDSTVTGGYPYRFTVDPVSAVKVSGGSVVCTGNGSPATSGDCYLTEEAQTSNANYTVLKVKISRWVQMLPFDLRVGDRVSIFGVYGMKDGAKVNPYDDGGYAYPLFTTKVASVSEPVEDPQYHTVTYEVRIEDPIPVNYLMSELGGGYIQAVARTVAMDYGAGMATATNVNINLGTASTALNFNTLAHGGCQTVVGSSNLPDYLARFIVGTGSATQGNTVDSETGMPVSRANGMLVAPQYGYFKLFDGAAGFSVSVKDSSSDWDGGYHMFEGATVRGGADTAHHSRLQVTENRSMMITRDTDEIARIGTANAAGSYSGAGMVSAVFSSLQGTAVVSSGSYIKAGTSEQSSLIDTLIGESRIVGGTVDDHDVAVYAAGGIELRSVGDSRGIHLWSNSYITQTFNGLMLEGNTFGALTATDKATSFVLKQAPGGTGRTGKLDDILWGETTGHSGFYYGKLDADSLKLLGTEKWNYGVTSAHIINSTALIGSETYNSVTIAIPDAEQVGKAIRPVVSSTVYHGIGNSNESPEVRYTKELAYVDDISGLTRISYGKAGAFGFVSNTDTTWTYPSVSGSIVQLPVYVGSNPAANVNIAYNSNEATLVDSFDIETNGTDYFRISHIRYQLTGQQVTVSFDIVPINNAGTGGFDDITFPFMLGCATSEHDGYPTSFLDTLHYTQLTGTVYRANANDAKECRAVLLGDGLLIVNLSSVDSIWVNNRRYHVNISGITPLVATLDCCGLSTNSKWIDSMIASKTSGKHPTYQDLISETEPYDMRYLINR